MALFRYFEKTPKKLPDPDGPLSTSIPSSSISAANSKVQPLLETATATVDDTIPGRRSKRGTYAKFSPEQKAIIGKRASEFGVVAAVKHFIKDYPNLKENTVRDWRDAYRQKLKEKVKEAKHKDEIQIQVTELPERKRGRPLLVGQELEQQIKDYLFF